MQMKRFGEEWKHQQLFYTFTRTPFSFVYGSVFLERQQCMSQSSTLSTSSIQEKDPTQLTLAESIDRAWQYPPNSSQAQEINKEVCHFLTMGMHPISTVEEIGFRSLMYKLNPRYNCPSRKHFSKKELPQLYTHV